MDLIFLEMHMNKPVDSNLQTPTLAVYLFMAHRVKGVPISGSAIPDSRIPITPPFGGEKGMGHLTMLVIMGQVHIPIGKAEVFGS